MVMNSPAKDIPAADVPEASLRMWWLGQAGLPLRMHM
jgi:hypothetical protein